MFWGLIVLLAVFVAIPVFIRLRLRPVDPALAPGQFVRLSQGVTHYRWIGPVRGPVVVAIHGLTTPSPVWDKIADGLGNTGYRVLVYDLYGRGYSDAVRGRQDRAFFLRQLDDLLTDQGLTEDLTLMGYSMGGAIATAYAADHPDRMKRVILLAPTGMDLNETPFERMTRRLPLIGDWVHAVAASARMGAQLMVNRGQTTEVEGIVDIQLAELRNPGFLSAVLSSRRGLLSDRQEADHRKVSHDDIPVIAIWGDRDTVVPIRALGTLSTWNRQAAQEVVAGAAHGLPHTHGSAVVELLRSVLREVN